ncbi:hypothetical protein HZA42_04965 [Candidatus Peregrinibacteria bacterium]|nr:hypothetical protein [Candidatus Peregrinibacteria bacterium]
MFKSENCKFRAKTLKADEPPRRHAELYKARQAVSGYDTVRRSEKFAAGICNLQLKDSFSEVP